jgi:hypothetical protein
MRLRRDRGAQVAIAAGALGIVAIAAGVVWASVAADTRARIEVIVDRNAFTCVDSANVSTYDWPLNNAGDVTTAVPALRVTPTLDCHFSFVVHNSSDIAVDVTTIALPTMGKIHGAGPYAVRLNNGNVVPEDVDDTTAFFRLTPNDGSDGSIQPHDAVKFSVPIKWDSGCLAFGTTIFVGEAPSLAVSALGISGAVIHHGPSFAYIGTRTSSPGCEK